MEYDQAARKRLGVEVRAARAKAFKNREAFAARIGRSGRQVQALENGESGVGPETWAAAAEGLGWPLSKVYALLDGKTPEPAAASTVLTTVSDDDLAAEVLRRMRGARDGNTSPTSDETVLIKDHTLTVEDEPASNPRQG